MSDTNEKVSNEEESPTKTRTRRGRPRKSSVKDVNPKSKSSKDEDTEKSSEEQEVNGDSENTKPEKVTDQEDNEDKMETEDQKENDVPELDDAPPPVVTTPTNSSKTLKLRTSLSTCENEDDEKKDACEKMEEEEFTVVEEVESDSDDVQEVPVDKTGEGAQTLEEMTVIDEVIDESEKKDSGENGKQDSNLEPDTEMVSEDELPAEVNKEPETEAVSDEELPTSGDLPDTEAVSEDELPPEASEKKKKKKKSTATSKGSSETDGSKEGGEGGTGKKESVKRKLGDGEYDPTSPTSEASEDSPAAKKVATDGKGVAKPSKPKALPELEKYWKAVREDPTDFTGWTYLLQYVDQENDVEAAREAYDAFLSNYPYCYGYWRKFADYEKRKGNKDKCEEVFERGLKAIPFSVDLWIHYINYCKATFADNEELLRNTFEKALEACGLEFRSDRLWEAYLKWENECKNLLNVTKIYDRLLATATQGYQSHFETFCEHVNNNSPSKVLTVDEFLELRQEVKEALKANAGAGGGEVMGAPGDDTEAPPGEEPDNASIEAIASPEETAKLKEKIIAVRKKVHLATKESVQARQLFEEGIKRPYFHVKPLERCQLKNWKDYLEFEIGQGDQRRVLVLFERCLIACALYEEFWLRYLRYLESKATDRVEMIRDVYRRACTIHHKKKPSLHLHWAGYEEVQGNFEKAAEILDNLEKIVPNLIQVNYRKINLTRRSGDMDKVSELYEHYIEKAKNRIVANNMTIKYARFSWKVLNDVDKSVSILKKALEKDKENPRLYLQLIDMAMQRTPVDETEVVAVIDSFLARDNVEVEQRVMFAQRKIEFLEDFGSSVKSVQKATDEFQKLLKQLQEKKKKPDDVKTKPEEPPSKKSDSKESTKSSHQGSSQGNQPPPSTGQYNSPGYNQGGYNQPPMQNNYQNYNQQPPYNQPYNQQYNQNDPNYNSYQNWSYSQPGYGNYNQGWGGYNYY